jgi:hypothetical protein
VRWLIADILGQPTLTDYPQPIKIPEEPVFFSAVGILIILSGYLRAISNTDSFKLGFIAVAIFLITGLYDSRKHSQEAKRQ